MLLELSLHSFPSSSVRQILEPSCYLLMHVTGIKLYILALVYVHAFYLYSLSLHRFAVLFFFFTFVFLIFCKACCVPDTCCCKTRISQFGINKVHHNMDKSIKLWNWTKIYHQKEHTETVSSQSTPTWESNLSKQFGLVCFASRYDNSAGGLRACPQPAMRRAMG